MGLLTDRKQLSTQEEIKSQNEQIIKLLKSIDVNIKSLYEEFLRETIRNQRRYNK